MPVNEHSVQPVVFSVTFGGRCGFSMDRFLRLTGFVLLLQLVPCGRRPVVRAQTSSETGAPSLGLTLGTQPVARTGWDRIERAPRWATWLYVPLRGPVGLVTELAWGRWQVECTSWGYYRNLTLDPERPFGVPLGLAGDDLTLLVGPVLHCGSIGPADLWLGATAGLGRHREWPFSPYGQIGDELAPRPPLPGGRHEIRAVAELRLRLGGARFGGLPALEIAHRWSRSQWMLREEPALVGSSETRLAVSTGLLPFPFRLERPERPLPRRPTSLYGRAVGGTLSGLTAAVVLVEGTAVVQGRKLGRALDYREGLLVGAVTGCALAITRERGDWRIRPLTLRLVGGGVVALAQGWVMREAFDFNLPDPGLMLTIPLGELLFDRRSSP